MFLNYFTSIVDDLVRINFPLVYFTQVGLYKNTKYSIIFIIKLYN